MNEEHLNELLSRFRNTRRYIWQLVAVAVILALGTSLVASAIFADTNIYISLALGLFLAIICLTYLAYSRLRENTYYTTIDSFFIIERPSNNVLNIPRYDFGSEFCDITAAAFTENPELKRQWWNEIEQCFTPFKDNSPRGLTYLRIACEVAEYILLETLHLCLSRYFQTTPSLEQSQLRVMARKDMPDVLLSNRILELISKEPQDRRWYQRFVRFELTMPRGSTIERSESGSLLINNRVISLELATQCWGFVYNLPSSFEHYYLGIDDLLGITGPEQARSILVTYTINARVKSGFRTRRSSWPYYIWMESFIDNAKRKLGAKEFFDRISWDSTEVLLDIILGRNHNISNTESGPQDDGSSSRREDRNENQ